MRRREFIALAGGIAAWPITGRAQQHCMNVIGFLSGDSAHLDGTRLSGLRRGLKEGGYIEGHNIAIEYRGAERQSARLAALAADLVGHPVSAIVAAGPTVALAAKALTATVPIVFTISGDPVALGLVASFNRPGGNVTGVSTLASDRFEPAPAPARNPARRNPVWLPRKRGKSAGRARDQTNAGGGPDTRARIACCNGCHRQSNRGSIRSSDRKACERNRRR